MRIAVCILLISFLLFTGCSSHQPKDERPNIILIFTDDQGMNDLSCFGSEIKTPHIDSIAKEGAKFTSWYVASSICTPSRFSLMTGHYPSRSKDRLLGPLMFLEEGDKNRGIQKGETTIATVLGDAGYETALIGKWHLGHGDKKMLPVSHGFQKFIGHTGGCIDFFTMRYGIKQDWYHGDQHKDTVGYATDIITDEAVNFISEKKEKPFFLYLSYNAPHFSKGWDVGRQQTINFLQAKDEDLKRVQHIEDPIRRQFAAMVKSLDDGIGRVMQALEDSGQAENTLVLFMADNGGDYKYGGSNKPFRGQKATLFEGGIRVPCVMKFPKAIKAGTVSNDQVGAIDLFPTFCKMAGLDPAKYKPDGHDIMNVLKGEGMPQREMLFELHNASALRVGDWKY
ncbi:MAG: sulfatase-like hydrolase/transferase, partial [Lentisphaeraceae bacterium]|nr:sulfatase-like hydrolase/transferase [Lentisphaeraceae bacterium]